MLKENLSCKLSKESFLLCPNKRTPSNYQYHIICSGGRKDEKKTYL